MWARLCMNTGLMSTGRGGACAFAGCVYERGLCVCGHGLCVCAWAVCMSKGSVYALGPRVCAQAVCGRAGRMYGSRPGSGPLAESEMGLDEPKRPICAIATGARPRALVRENTLLGARPKRGV